MEKKVAVEYQTKKIYCHCCGHKLEKPTMSKVREFYFSKDDCLQWLEQEHWRTQAECDELDEIIREFVYETISFFATSSDVKILINESEFSKVKHFILSEIVVQCEK